MIAPQEEINIHFSLGCAGGPNHANATEETLQRHRIFGTMPHYPSAAIKAGISGVVVMETVINTEGDVTDVRIIEGNPILAGAARKAVKEWKYRPVVVDGTPIEARKDVVLVFQLGQRPSVVESSPSNRARA